MSAPVVVLSGGGIKTAVVAARYAGHHELVLVHVNYGQRGSPGELAGTRALAEHFGGGRVVVLDVPFARQIQEQVRSSAGPAAGAIGVVGTDVLSSQGLGGLVMSLLSLGVECAIRVGGARVVIGLSSVADAGHLGLSGSAEGRTWVAELVHAMGLALATVVDRPPGLEAPLSALRYVDLVRAACHLRLPLKQLWSCQQPDHSGHPCGRCGGCKERRRSFAEAGAADPIDSTTGSTVQAVGSA